MTATKKGWDQSLMIGYHAKETAYNTAMTVNATNFSGVKGHSDYDPDWADDVQTDKDTVTGYEHGTNLEIVTQGFKTTIAQPRAKPNFVIGMMAAALGGITSAQDGALAAYSHKCLPVAAGTLLPSFNLIGLKGGLQYLHTGCMVDSVSLSMEAGKPVSCEAQIIGSGYRATNAAGFIAEPSESWLLMKDGYTWIEQDANIAIAATPTQGAEGISSATPDDIKATIMSAKYTRKNNLVGQFGAGNGNNYFQGMDYGVRANELAITLLHTGATELGWYTAGTILAVQLEVKGALIAGGGAMYFGYVLRIPRFKLNKAPLPKGAANEGAQSIELSGDVQNDGTNSDVVFWGYNAKSAFFA